MKPIHHRLGAMVAGAHGDSLPVQHRSDIVRMNPFHHEREHRGFLARRADIRRPGMRESTSVP